MTRTNVVEESHGLSNKQAAKLAGKESSGEWQQTPVANRVTATQVGTRQVGHHTRCKGINNVMSVTISNVMFRLTHSLTMDRLFVGRDTDRTVTDGAMKALAPASSRHTTTEMTRENIVLDECV